MAKSVLNFQGCQQLHPVLQECSHSHRFLHSILHWGVKGPCQRSQALLLWFQTQSSSLSDVANLLESAVPGLPRRPQLDLEPRNPTSLRYGKWGFLQRPNPFQQVPVLEVHGENGCQPYRFRGRRLLNSIQTDRLDAPGVLYLTDHNGWHRGPHLNR